MQKVLRPTKRDMNWNKLDDEEVLEKIDSESAAQPVMIFKHSTRCSISAAALNRMERNWNDSDSEKVKPYFLDLLANRSLSNSVAERYNVQHESPQVLVIKNGQCIYNASHMDISYKDILEQV